MCHQSEGRLVALGGYFARLSIISFTLLSWTCCRSAKYPTKALKFMALDRSFYLADWANQELDTVPNCPYQSAAVHGSDLVRISYPKCN
ncbi:hypothetical protein HOY82DRAFT_564561 [Tuber indicum]|nr:hypothetical protein HOY82DRAFT_564561 [Tuber indicum]